MTDIQKRPVIIIANSSWYIKHYRQLLIEKILENDNLVLISPIDKFTGELKRYAKHIPINMNKLNFKILSIFSSLFKLLIELKSLKPKLVHSHTLEANFLTSIVCRILSINNVISFAGIGKFSTNNKITKEFFFLLIRVIILFSYKDKSKNKKINKISSKTIFIFQNYDDLNIIRNKVKSIRSIKYFVIPGSGIPKKYLDSTNSLIKTNNWKNKESMKSDDHIEMNTTFIYCARLLKSKGIITFLNLSIKLFKSHFKIYGSSDPLTKDSITDEDIIDYKNKYKNISFEGNIKDPLMAIYSKYPVLIIPSNYGEGFPRALIEANSLYIPVITSYEVSKKVSCDLLSYLCKDNSEDEYISCYNKILNDHHSGKLIKKLERNREIVNKLYSEENIVCKTLELYEDINKLQVKIKKI